jgi:hypothetical protein
VSVKDAIAEAIKVLQECPEGAPYEDLDDAVNKALEILLKEYEAK